MVGKQIQQYQFVEKLGAGGMGEIYKAHDSRLNRTVAIKVLPSAKSGDPDRRRRFLHEAQAASGLNHPSIITIHDVISDDNTEYMVMEYVQGRTLNDLIPKGGLRVPQALKYAMQMADALAAAHAAGIIHRDLKPANIMVTDSGFVKILDFGLAKLTDRTADLGDNTQTIGAPLTVEGAILGTVSYMSPEQAQGMKIDTRSDVFSFGAVLYEMVTGKRAFEGESSLSTLSSILRDETAPIGNFAPDVPQELEAVIQRCLRKNPDERFQSMRDVQAGLGVLKRDSDSGSLYTQTVQTRVSPPAMGSPLSHSRGSASVAPAPPPPADSSGMSPKMAIAIGALVALLIGGGGGTYFLMKKRGDKAAAEVAAAQAAAQAATPAAPVEALPPPPPEKPKDSMDNQDIMQLMAAKVPPDLILSQIRAANETKFDLSTDQIIALSKVGVPGNIIEQMRNPKRALPAAVMANAVAAAAKIAKQEKPVPVAPEPTKAVVVVPAPTPVPIPIATTPSAPLTTAPVRAPEARTVNVTLNDALPFTIKIAAEIPQDSDIGQPVRFIAADDFRVNGVVVIAKGAAITGDVSETQKKKTFGFGGGKLSFKLNKVESVAGTPISVRAMAARRADGPTQRPVEKGRADYIAYIDGEQHLTVPQK